jgi:steroid delta-isomerase-like uncharacterized protein
MVGVVMISEQNSKIIRELYSMVSSKREQCIHNHINTAFNSNISVSGSTDLRRFNHFFSSINTAFPDNDLIIDNVIAKDDRVLVRYSILGTHKGDFMGFTATNQKFTITGINVFRLDSGKIVEYWDGAYQMCALSPNNRDNIIHSEKIPSESKSIKTSRKKPLGLKV